MQFQPVIRWSGGKRKQSEEIIDQMPSRMGTLFIPFLGGGSVMYQAINSNIKYDRVVVSDIYDTLMDVWDLIKNDPGKLINGYADLAARQDLDRKFYDEALFKFNTDGGKDPIYFYFLTRACTRGSLTYDRYGNFMSSMSDKDVCARPRIVEPIIMRWSEAIQEVEFRCESYEYTIADATEDDFVFMDPPYIDGTWYKHHSIEWDKMWDIIRNLPCDYSLTLNGDKDVYPIPEDLYTEHMYIYYGVSATSQGNKRGNRDSLWMRKQNGIYLPDKRNSKTAQRHGGGKSESTVSDTKALFELGDRMNKLESSVVDMKQSMSNIEQMLSAFVNLKG